ncbi:MAG: glycosyltransferase [Verrucomicrobiota bacterium]
MGIAKLLARPARRDYEQAVLLNVVLGILAVLSLGLLLWQWLAALRFPLHQRRTDRSYAPAVTVLKPLKGADDELEACLRSWFAQDYAGPVQILLGTHLAEDSAGPVVNKLLAEFPDRDARLVLTGEDLGTNGKVSNLAQLARHAKHEVFVISDGDIRVPRDFLTNAVLPLSSRKGGEGRGEEANSSKLPSPQPSPRLGGEREKDNVSGATSASAEVGLVNCFYRLANPSTPAMHWEAIAINADFWSQVLQSKTLKPLDFALGAVMVTRRSNLREIGGFEALLDCLADDYQLGHRIAKQGHRIELCPVVVECWHAPQTWGAVWKHQLRWARTVRVCQPAPYFFSILSNPTLWPLVWLMAQPGILSAGFFGAALVARILITENLSWQLTQKSGGAAPLLAPLKDLLQFALWLGAFLGHTVEWRGQRFHLRRDGTLAKLTP